MQITTRKVTETADYVVRLSARLYTVASKSGDMNKAHRHRDSCIDNLEGLKALLHNCNFQDTTAYSYLQTLSKTVTEWP